MFTTCCKQNNCHPKPVTFGVFLQIFCLHSIPLRVLRGILLFLITINLIIVSKQQYMLVHNQYKDGICYLMCVLAAAHLFCIKQDPYFTIFSLHHPWRKGNLYQCLISTFVVCSIFSVHHQGLVHEGAISKTSLLMCRSSLFLEVVNKNIILAGGAVCPLGCCDSMVPPCCRILLLGCLDQEGENFFIFFPNGTDNKFHNVLAT